MPRFKLTVEYDGTGLLGWQRQEEGPTVQEHVETAIKAVCGETLTIHCAGRTDAGVHALGQVIHVDFPRDWPARKVLQAINFHLHHVPIAVVKSERVDESFHARFSATGRRYMYRIINRPARLALDIGRAWHVPKPLNIVRMQEAANHLIGTYDFTSFRDSECQGKSPVKTLDELRLEQFSDDEIRIHAASRSFLHHQVRIITGSLVNVGKARWSVDDFIKARDAKDRKAGGPTAPACGLFFISVAYE